LNTGGGWTDYYYKPGAKKVTSDLKKRVADQQIMDWELRTFYRTH
jgi:ABC-type sulfate transport system substrate-binding protein